MSHRGSKCEWLTLCRASLLCLLYLSCHIRNLILRSGLGGAFQSQSQPGLEPLTLSTTDSINYKGRSPPHVFWRKSREHFNQRPEDSERLFRSRWGIFWINDSRCTSKDALHYHRNEHERGANGRVHWSHSNVCVQLSESWGVGGRWEEGKNASERRSGNWYRPTRLSTFGFQNERDLFIHKSSEFRNRLAFSVADCHFCALKTCNWCHPSIKCMVFLP